MAERLPLTLSAYRVITAAGTAVAPHLLERRRRRGKEHAGANRANGAGNPALRGCPARWSGSTGPASASSSPRFP